MNSSKIALVTGSGKKRVGHAIAETLAKAGYSIAVHYRSSEAEAAETVAFLQSLGVKAVAFQADLADEQAVTRLMDAVWAEFGRLDVLVNSAAIWNRKPLEQVTAADVREHFETNTLGTFLCAQIAGLRMVAQLEGGCIINIGDWAEIRPYLDYAAYFPSKGGVTTLTRSLAVELGTRNPKVRVNAVLPGPVMLPPDMPDEERRQAINATLVKREGTPHHVAKAVLSLIDNDFITGVCLPVDGGRSIYSPED
ncbi:SDR family NAD(P)-dependent oxidoreductase [Zavarzinella formosa]|uniref:SDR family NAD(P)-dependent oxidoreductase n=1 Tax=Zavarzinella formosa TaxID=360055 RepID=UPI00030324E3|nr:SDR family oxidoreductase [Zavarzinella formosa]